MATGYGAANFLTVNITAFAADAERLSGGKLHIDVQPDAKLFKLNDIQPAVEAGKIELGETIMSAMVNEFALAGVDSLPFVVGSYDDARRLWESQRPLLDKSLSAKGLKILFAVPWPPQGLFTKNEVRGPGDLQGLKMRTYNPITVRIAQALGATPVDVAAGDVHDALVNGRIDSLITSPVTGVESKVWDGLGYFYELNAWIPKNAVLVNMKSFAALDPATQQALLRAAAEAEVRGWESSKKEASNAIAQLKIHKMTVSPTPMDLRQRVDLIGEKFSLEWVRTIGNDAVALFVPYYTSTTTGAHR